MRKFACFFVLLLIWSVALQDSLARDETDSSSRLTVSTHYGAVRGTGDELRAYLGIPYAAPPVGDLRWRPPQPPVSWTGVRDATRPGSSCVQARDPQSSEDCLYLNVWTPAKTATDRLPVLFWIHGGGFVAGSGYSSNFNGSALARKGVLVVSINYRLGVFGALAHPDLTAESPHHASGNYGLMDQIQALRWVRENIAAFGGDPQRVTIFGESAGATSIGYLLVSPLARGLFHAAILQSPSRVLLPDPELKTTVNGITPMESVGTAISPHIADIRSWDTAKVIQQAKAVTDRLYAPGGEAKLGIRPESHIHMPAAHDAPWWAFVDGWVIPKQTETLYRSGAATAVPVIAGANANEGSVFLRNFPIQTEQQYVDYISQNYQPCSQGMLNMYTGADAPTIKAAADRIITDALFLYGARGILQAESHKKQKVFLYQFARTSKNPESAPLGAWHGADVPYVFGSANPASDPQRFNKTDEKISDEMMDRWAQFAANTNPNGNDSTKWPMWSEKNESYLEFNAQTEAKKLPSHIRNRFRMFEQIFSVPPAKTCTITP